MGPFMIYQGTAYDLPPRPLMIYRFARIKVDRFKPKLTTKPKQTQSRSPQTAYDLYLFCRNGFHQDSLCSA
eukprot:3511368-Amphidinium_carterae.1